MFRIRSICAECYIVSDCAFFDNPTPFNTIYSNCDHWLSFLTYLIDSDNLCQFIVNVTCQKCKFAHGYNELFKCSNQKFAPKIISCNCISSAMLDDPLKKTKDVKQSIVVGLTIDDNKQIDAKYVQNACQTKVPHVMCEYCDDGYYNVYKDCECVKNNICIYCNNTTRIECDTYGCSDGHRVCTYCNGFGRINDASILNVLSGQIKSKSKKCIKCKSTGYEVCVECKGYNSVRCNVCRGTSYDNCTRCKGKAYLKCENCRVKLACLICNNTKRVKTDIVKKCKMCVLVH
jgi:hypothetical protein